ncbi:MAG: hypothetical protein ACFCU9_07005 [Cyanophyceae cyanobacterium]
MPNQKEIKKYLHKKGKNPVVYGLTDKGGTLWEELSDADGAPIKNVIMT